MTLALAATIGSKRRVSSSSSSSASWRMAYWRNRAARVVSTTAKQKSRVYVERLSSSIEVSRRVPPLGRYILWHQFYPIWDIYYLAGLHCSLQPDPVPPLDQRIIPGCSLVHDPLPFVVHSLKNQVAVVHLCHAEGVRSAVVPEERTPGIRFGNPDTGAPCTVTRCRRDDTVFHLSFGMSSRPSFCPRSIYLCMVTAYAPSPVKRSGGSHCNMTRHISGLRFDLSVQEVGSKAPLSHSRIESIWRSRRIMRETPDSP